MTSEKGSRREAKCSSAYWRVMRLYGLKIFTSRKSQSIAKSPKIKPVYFIKNIILIQGLDVLHRVKTRKDNECVFGVDIPGIEPRTSCKLIVLFTAGLSALKAKFGTLSNVQAQTRLSSYLNNEHTDLLNHSITRTGFLPQGGERGAPPEAVCPPGNFCPSPKFGPKTIA